MNKIKLKTDIVYNDKTKKDIIIAHIADIHFNTNTKLKDLNKVKEYLIKMKPDYLIITGDLIDSPYITKNTNKIKELLLFLTDISKHIKIIISLGNHDTLLDDDYKFFNKLNDLYNIYVLNNSIYQDEFIYITGFNLPNEYYYNITNSESLDILLKYLDNNSKILTKLPSSIPKVALIHSPIKLTDESVLKKLKEYDLILCGHTHNGMVPDILEPIFKGNLGLIAPNKSLFPSIAKGKIEKNIDNKKIIIIINGAITKLSLQSGKILSNLNFIYNKSVNKIIIRKKRGYNYEQN